MVHLVAAFYAVIFMFCHATTVRRTEAQVLPPTTVQYGTYVPTREEAARGEFPASYAGDICLSCMRTNVVYNER